MTGPMVRKEPDTGEIITTVGPTPQEYMTRLARRHSPEAVRTVLQIMRNHEVSAGHRLRAAEMIIDRGYGKAVQGVQLQDPSGNAIPIRTIEVVINKAPNGKQELQVVDHSEDDTFIEGVCVPEQAEAAIEPVTEELPLPEGYTPPIDPEVDEEESAFHESIGLKPDVRAI